MTTKIFAAFVKAQAEIEKAAKDSVNPHFRKKYADLGNVVDAIKPALEKHGLAFFQKFHENPDGIAIETIIAHESGESFSNGVLFVPATKRDAQGYGSACTYARRYSLQAAFGVAPDDDDGNAASKPSPSNHNKGDRGAPAQHEHEPDAPTPSTEADAMVVAQLNAAATVPDLVKVMNSLTNEQQKMVRPNFNQRMNELKKAA